MKKQSVWSLGNLACHLFSSYKEYVYFSVSCQPSSDSGGAMHPSVYADGLSGWGMYSPRTSGLEQQVQHTILCPSGRTSKCLELHSPTDSSC